MFWRLGPHIRPAPKGRGINNNNNLYPYPISISYMFHVLCLIIYSYFTCNRKDSIQFFKGFFDEAWECFIIGEHFYRVGQKFPFPSPFPLGWGAEEPHINFSTSRIRTYVDNVSAGLQPVTFDRSVIVLYIFYCILFYLSLRGSSRVFPGKRKKTEMKGFEPLVSFVIQWLSKPTLSTTRPHFHVLLILLLYDYSLWKLTGPVCCLLEWIIVWPNNILYCFSLSTFTQ